MSDNNNIFKAFFSKKKPNREMNRLYDMNRKLFFLYAKKNYQIDDEVIKDIYQDAFFAVAENIQSGRLNPENLNVSFRTYLFRIGINKLNNYVRDNEKYTKLSDNEYEMSETSNHDSSELRAIIWQEVINLVEPCNKILSLFYFEKKSIKHIAKETGYKSEQAAKNKKMLCLKLLKDVILKKYKEDLQ